MGVSLRLIIKRGIMYVVVSIGLIGLMKARSYSAITSSAMTLSATTSKVTPNDPYFSNQIGFENSGDSVTFDSYSHKKTPKTFHPTSEISLQAPAAWAKTTGDSSVIVAIIDDGFFYNHEDLEGNIWKNPGESGVDDAGYRKETNGLDDDGNGYKDDVMGWDFPFDDPDPDAYVFDGMDRNRIQPYSHSISAMGIIGAKGNNGIGVAGLNWKISMMLLKIAAQGEARGTHDTLRLGRAAKAIRYAADNGARVINWSGFVVETDSAAIAPLKSAIKYAGSKNVLLVVAAGNRNRNLDKPENITYPACFDLENIISVAEIDFSGNLERYEVGEKVWGSNWGPKRVHIGAIGEHFTTSLKNGRSIYGTSGGTSNAAPVITGVASLMLSVRPELTALELKRLLIKSVTPLAGLEGKIESAGIINAKLAVENALNY